MAQHALFRYFVVPEEIHSAEPSTILDSGERILKVRLLEDPQLQFSSSFSKGKDLLPGFLQFISTYQSITSTVGGQVSDWQKNLDLQFWQNTEPLKISIKLLLHNEYDPYGGFLTNTGSKNNVWKPMNQLASLSILSKLKNGGYKIPGANLSNMGLIKDSLEKGMITDNNSQTSKIITFEIPGVIYLPVAVVENTSVITSKDKTTSGYPLWAEMSIGILSLESANDSMFSSFGNSQIEGLSFAQAAGFKF